MIVRHRLFIASAALLLSACAIFNAPRTTLVPTDSVQASVDKRFPRDVRYKELFNLKLTNPKLTLLPEGQPDGNRATLTMDATLAPLFVKRAWTGRITVSGGLKIDAQRRTVILNAPQLDKFEFAGFDPAMSREITQYGASLAEQIMRGVPLLLIDDVSVPFGANGAAPLAVSPSSEGLVITFEAASGKTGY